MYRLVLLLVLACNSDLAMPRKLVLIAGQSNAIGYGLASQLVGTEHAPLLDAFPVPFFGLYGNGQNPPTTLEHGWANIGPRTRPLSDGTPYFHYGVELSIARALEASEPGGWAIAKIAQGGISLYQWLNGWPSLDPEGPWRQQVTDKIGELLATQDYEMGAIVWIQGESDATTALLANQYAANLLILVDELRSLFGEVPFVYGRLHTALVGQAAFPASATVRAQQLAAEAQRRDMFMVDQDPFSLGSDAIHFTGLGLVGLGYAYAEAVILADSTTWVADINELLLTETGRRPAIEIDLTSPASNPRARIDQHVRAGLSADDALRKLGVSVATAEEEI